MSLKTSHGRGVSAATPEQEEWIDVLPIGNYFVDDSEQLAPMSDWQVVKSVLLSAGAVSGALYLLLQVPGTTF